MQAQFDFSEFSQLFQPLDSRNRPCTQQLLLNEAARDRLKQKVEI